MSRRNRKKLHLELRLRAEARKAEAVARRRARREQAERDRLALAEAFRRRRTLVPSAATGGYDPALRECVERLLRLAQVTKRVRRAVHALYDVVAASLPELCTVESLPFHLLLARQDWLRPLAAWTPPSGSWRRRRDALATWLLARYRVPTFLLAALEVEPAAVARVPVEDEWAFALIAHLGRGGSLAAVVGTPLMPAPLTRRMCHRFVTTPAGHDPVVALRLAQVTGVGGEPSLAHALARTRLGRLQGPDAETGEPWWQQVIGWLATRDALPQAALDDVIDWLDASRRAAVAEGRSFDLKGRTLASVTAAATTWRAQQAVRADVFRPSGYLPLEVVEDRVRWSVEEIRDVAALTEEGRAMAHCVAAYRNLVSKGKASVWSLRRDGERRATVEVACAAGRVVQAKRRANAAVEPDERAVIERWAACNRLAVGF